VVSGVSASSAGPVLHVRYEGRSDELSLRALELSPGAGDQAIKRALARHYGRSPDAFAGHVVVRTSEAIIVRPEAVYG
jgi:hypothetical protein